ncbi:helix-turn-helix domain-containing protein [Chryseobacterium sp. CKR4-1]|uniref:helix-turn-helix domain-containing protein n=1 Tax=Chryseobacterium sp. CKR4-1 TaxID=3068896 RepID=UPI0027965CF9|nr:helix-turn-helix domain-containing protein [Chryseobacterium sp. CKR4-1]MDQ1803069.1 helix-turn-helix domain-containing protein [Chryseobacterium sp. CKR4-1]
MDRLDDKIVLYEIGANIRKKRIELGWTQTDLGIAAGGMGVGRISEIENGLRDLHTVTLVTIIWALGAEPGEIIPYTKKDK